MVDFPTVRTVNQQVLRGTKKSRVMTQELMGKFSSKSDFIKYFSEGRKCNTIFLIAFGVVQLYVPPAKMMNKDFLKKVLTEEKQLLQLSEVKYVIVPHYEELSVKKFYPILSSDEKFMSYMPDLPVDNRLPERTYFWNVANTL